MVLFSCCFIAQLIENNSNVSRLVQLPKRELNVYKQIIYS